MKQPRVANPEPIVTLITTTHRRPEALARNLASVGSQTAVLDIEQIVLPDHVGLGIVGGLYGRLPQYAAAIHGRYVNILNDDDALAGPVVVSALKLFIAKHKSPPVIIVSVRKGDATFPKQPPLTEPIEGDVDLGSYIVRADVWRAHVGDYGQRYQGDYDHACALWHAGHAHVHFNLLWAVGPAGGGRPEAIP